MTVMCSENRPRPGLPKLVDLSSRDLALFCHKVCSRSWQILKSKVGWLSFFAKNAGIEFLPGRTQWFGSIVFDLIIIHKTRVRVQSHVLSTDTILEYCRYKSLLANKNMNATDAILLNIFSKHNVRVYLFSAVSVWLYSSEIIMWDR